MRRRDLSQRPRGLCGVPRKHEAGDGPGSQSAPVPWLSWRVTLQRHRPLNFFLFRLFFSLPQPAAEGRTVPTLPYDGKVTSPGRWARKPAASLFPHQLRSTARHQGRFLVLMTAPLPTRAAYREQRPFRSFLFSCHRSHLGGALASGPAAGVIIHTRTPVSSRDLGCGRESETVSTTVGQRR